MTRFLQSEEQVQVHSVSSGQGNLLQKVQSVVPDVILIDLDPSVKDSLDRIAAIRSILPDGLIIAMTLLDTIYYHKSVIAAGADDLIYKMELNANFLIDLHTRLVRRRRIALKPQRNLLPGRMIPNP